MPDRQTLRRWSRVALSSPPRQTAMIGARKLRGWYAGLLERQRSGSRPSYDLARTTGAQLARFVEPPRHEMLASRREQLTALADLYLDHRFDLLGSGWVRVQHGMSATGVDGIRYARSPSIAHEDDRKSVMGLLNHANRAEATRIHALISRAYQAIDWQLDFKSGFRWSEATWFREIRYGAARGADVKVPWELGRCQHLPQLALAAVLASEDGDAERVDRLRQEFRDQVLDVVSANPPRFGVQWVSTMDVAIRVANWLLAWDLLRSTGVAFDQAFSDVFARSVAEHGQHIATNLEWSANLRGNHYLADIVGLLYVAAYLPSSAQADAWLLFSARELLSEVRFQFLDDGANFEGSTCYHRLSAEMATYGVAILLALPEERAAVLFQPPGAVLASSKGFAGSEPSGLTAHDIGRGRPSPVPLDILDRLGRARWFTVHITKPSGAVPQIGDNDNGRFFKLAPAMTVAVGDERTSAPREDHLDHRHVVEAIDGLLGRPTDPDVTGSGLDGSIVSGLATPQAGWRELGGSGADRVRIGASRALRDFEARLNGLPADRRRDLVIELGSTVGDADRFGYPAFGLYVIKSPRFYLAIRCGPRGQRGFGGHDHNDQLGIELAVDGEDCDSRRGQLSLHSAARSKEPVPVRARPLHAPARGIGTGEPGRRPVRPGSRQRGQMPVLGRGGIRRRKQMGG